MYLLFLGCACMSSGVIFTCTGIIGVQVRGPSCLKKSSNVALELFFLHEIDTRIISTSCAVEGLKSLATLRGKQFLFTGCRVLELLSIFTSRTSFRCIKTNVADFFCLLSLQTFPCHHIN